MTTPAGVTTPTLAAQWAWDHGTALLPQNTPATGIKQKHFNTRPMRDIAGVACPNAAALAEFKTAWTALQKKHNTKVNAPAGAGAPAAKTVAQQIYDDMRSQFERWKKAGCKSTTRGAWWGSKGPGITAGAKAVPQGEIRAITALAEKGNWTFKNSFSGDLSWHKSGGSGKPDFIYHTKTP